MKKIIVTAAALMLGTSALAWAPAEEAHLVGSAITSAKSDWSADKSPMAFSSFDKGLMKAENTALATSADWSKGGMDASSSWAKSDDETMVPKAFAKWEDPGVDSSATASADMSDVKGAVKTAMNTKTQTDWQTASADAGKDAGMETGMGGPLEDASGYPPCDPGPGDDHCIQLYERGVTQQLAAWKGSDSNVGMGGPYEPVAGEGAKDQTADMSDHSAMDHSAMPSGTATTDKPAATMESDSSAATMSKPTGMDSTAGTSPGAVGGPVEARSGYPACSRTVTDRCIQLYERGVSGQGN